MQVLNVEDAYLSRSQRFIRSLFSGVQGNGRTVGLPGGACRSGQWQSFSVHGVSVVLKVVGGGPLMPPCSAAPTLGKSWAMMPSCVIASRDR